MAFGGGLFSSILPVIAKGALGLMQKGGNFPTQLAGGLVSDLGLPGTGAAIGGLQPFGGGEQELSPGQALFEDIMVQLRNDPEAASKRLSELSKGTKAVSKARESGMLADQFMQENPDLGALFQDVDQPSSRPGSRGGQFTLMDPRMDLLSSLYPR